MGKEEEKRKENIRIILLEIVQHCEKTSEHLDAQMTYFVKNVGEFVDKLEKTPEANTLALHLSQDVFHDIEKLEETITQTKQFTQELLAKYDKK